MLTISEKCTHLKHDFQSAEVKQYLPADKLRQIYIFCLIAFLRIMGMCDSVKFETYIPRNIYIYIFHSSLERQFAIHIIKLTNISSLIIIFYSLRL